MSTSPMPSFDRARYAGDPPPPDACAYCGRGLAGTYFRVGGHLACETCAQRAESLVPPDSHRAYTRAVLYGVGAAIAGCIGYAMFEILSGIMLGYIAIGVGYLVGWAMKKGSGGLGGRRYQITAALLTYAAVAVAFVPITLHAARGARSTETAAQRVDAHDADAAKADAAHATGTQPSAHAQSFGSFLLAILILLGIGLASPFLLLTASLGHGLLQLFIIFLGVRFAWQNTASKRVDVEGPYTAATSPLP